MKRMYQKPEAEYISLISHEDISTMDETTGEIIEGSMGLEDSIFG